MGGGVSVGKANVMVIEGDPTRLYGLISNLSAEPDLNVVGSGRNHFEAIAGRDAKSDVHVILANLDSPGMCNPHLWALTKVLFPSSAFVFLVHKLTIQPLTLAILLEPIALHSPTVSPRELIHEIRRAPESRARETPLRLRDNSLEDPSASPILPIKMGYFRIDTAARRGTIANRAKRLTDREKAVLRHMGRGSSNQHIANNLRIKEGTVAFHLSNVYRKLGISSRSEAGILCLLVQELKFEVYPREFI